MISIDGDTSTNDMVTVLANGCSGSTEITEADEGYELFSTALYALTERLCRMIAADGEGATKLLICEVSGALDESQARAVARTVISSNLCKAAFFGGEANWGRVLCAIGYSPTEVAIDRVRVTFSSAAGDVVVCENGAGKAFDEAHAQAVLKEKEIRILIDLNSGTSEATAYGCDLTYDYVRINGEYLT